MSKTQKFQLFAKKEEKGGKEKKEKKSKIGFFLLLDKWIDGTMGIWRLMRREAGVGGGGRGCGCGWLGDSKRWQWCDGLIYKWCQHKEEGRNWVADDCELPSRHLRQVGVEHFFYPVHQHHHLFHSFPRLAIIIAALKKFVHFYSRGKTQQRCALLNALLKRTVKTHC